MTTIQQQLVDAQLKIAELTDKLKIYEGEGIATIIWWEEDVEYALEDMEELEDLTDKQKSTFYRMVLKHTVDEFSGEGVDWDRFRYVAETFIVRGLHNV